MSKLIRLVLAALLIIGIFWSNSAFSDSALGPLQDIKTDSDVNQWLTYYYLYPQPDLTLKVIFLCEKKAFRISIPSRSLFICLFRCFF